VDPTYLLLAVLIVALPFLLTKLLSGKSRDADRVLGASVPSARSAVKPASAPAMEAANDAAPIEAQVKALIAQGKKIEAIKLMRESNGLSLEAAKDSVEAIEQHGRSTLGEMGMMSTIRLAQQLSKEVHELVASGQKVEAIRLVRDQTGLGLKEAKELVDRLG
jgi:ribosomal protein L7/L12